MCKLFRPHPTPHGHVVHTTQCRPIGSVNSVRKVNGKDKVYVTYPPDKQPGRKGFDLQFLLPIVVAIPSNPELVCVGQVVQTLGGKFAGQFGVTMKTDESAAKWQLELHGGKVVYVICVTYM